MFIKFHFSVIVLGSGNGRAVLVLRKRLDYDSGERNFNLTIKAQVICFSINYKTTYTLYQLIVSAGHGQELQFNVNFRTMDLPHFQPVRSLQSP